MLENDNASRIVILIKFNISIPSVANIAGRMDKNRHITPRYLTIMARVGLINFLQCPVPALLSAPFFFLVPYYYFIAGEK